MLLPNDLVVSGIFIMNKNFSFFLQTVPPLPRSILVVFKFIAYSCHCSADTELIDRKNNAINCINCILISTEVYRQLSSSFTFQLTPGQWSRLNGKWDVRFLRIPTTYLPEYGPRLLVDYSLKDTTFSQNVVQ